jgi:hypothetical protein
MMRAYAVENARQLTLNGWIYLYMRLVTMAGPIIHSKQSEASTRTRVYTNLCAPLGDRRLAQHSRRQGARMRTWQGGSQPGLSQERTGSDDTL